MSRDLHHPSVADVVGVRNVETASTGTSSDAYQTIIRQVCAFHRQSSEVAAVLCDGCHNDVGDSSAADR